MSSEAAAPLTSSQNPSWIYQQSVALGNGIKQAGSRAYTCATTCSSNFYKKHQVGLDRIKNFISSYWGAVVKQVLAWGVVITGVGLLYGFKATALPLTIGLACGVGFGILTGFVMAFCIDPKGEKLKGKNTVWLQINNWINSLDQHGTRSLLQQVSITVFFAATFVFPHVMGGLYGAMLGNHFATKAIYALRGIDDSNPNADPLENRVKALELQVEELMKEKAEKVKALELKVEELMKEKTKKENDVEAGVPDSSLSKNE